MKLASNLREPGQGCHASPGKDPSGKKRKMPSDRFPRNPTGKTTHKTKDIRRHRSPFKTNGARQGKPVAEVPGEKHKKCPDMLDSLSTQQAKSNLRKWEIEHIRRRSWQSQEDVQPLHISPLALCEGREAGKPRAIQGAATQYIRISNKTPAVPSRCSAKKSGFASI